MGLLQGLEALRILSEQRFLLECSSSCLSDGICVTATSFYQTVGSPTAVSAFVVKDSTTPVKNASTLNS